MCITVAPVDFRAVVRATGGLNEGNARCTPGDPKQPLMNLLEMVSDSVRPAIPADNTNRCPGNSNTRLHERPNEGPYQCCKLSSFL